MAQKNVLITFVSLNQAKEGFTFLHKGPTQKCEGCEYFRVCIENLESGRIYRVVGLREKKVHCRLTETEMNAVEVVAAEIEAAIQSKLAMEGAIILFQAQECCLEGCENLKFCSPRGLFNGDHYEIVKITGNLQCPQRSPLVRVVLRRVPVS